MLLLNTFIITKKLIKTTKDIPFIRTNDVAVRIFFAVEAMPITDKICKFYKILIIYYLDFVNLL